MVGKQWAGTSPNSDHPAAQAFGTLIKEMMGVAAHNRVHATDHDRGWHPRLHTQANFGGEKTRMWNAIARHVENGNRAHKMEWPGPRTYLDDVPLQLRLLSSFLRAPNRISGLGRCSFRVDAAGVSCQNISKHATLV